MRKQVSPPSHMTERLSLVFAALIERRLSVGAIKH